MHSTPCHTAHQATRTKLLRIGVVMQMFHESSGCLQVLGAPEGASQAMAQQRLPALPEGGTCGTSTASRSRRPPRKDTGQERLEELGYHQELQRSVYLSLTL